MGIRLTYTLQGKKQKIKICDGSYILGRSRKCDCVLADPSVSGQHLRIDCQGDDVSVRDLLSSNGTFLNDERIREAIIRPGDRLKIGKLAMEVMPEKDSPDDEYITPAAPLPQIKASPEVEEATPVHLPSVEPPPPADAQLPAVRDVHAVEVVRPQPQPEKTSTKKKLFPVVIGVLVLLTLVLALLPSSGSQLPDKPRRSRSVSKKEYWAEVEKGASAFRRQEYDKAISLWGEIQADWIEENPSKPLRAAGIFADMARIMKKSKQNLAPVAWTDRGNAILDLLNESLLPQELESFAENLYRTSQNEARAQKTYQNALSSLQQGELDAAEKQFLEIPNQSVYYRAVPTNLEAIKQERFRRVKDQALSHARLQNWTEAVRVATQALSINDDKDLRSKIAVWNENARLQSQMQKARRLASSIQQDSLLQAKQILDALPEHELTRQAPAMLEEVERKLFELRLSGLYHAGDITALDEARKSTHASSITARRIFTKLDTILGHLSAADKSIKSKNFFAARKQWEHVLSVEHQKQNAFRKKAEVLLGEWPLSRIGENERLAGIKAFADGRFREARAHLEVARIRCGIDVSAEVESIQKRGKSLYNEAANDIIQGARTQGHDKLLQARDCFLSTERWFEKVEQKLRKEFGS